MRALNKQCLVQAAKQILFNSTSTESIIYQSWKIHGLLDGLPTRKGFLMRIGLNVSYQDLLNITQATIIIQSDMFSQTISTRALTK